MKPQVGDLRTVTQRFDGKEWVLCLQSMPPKELNDEEIEKIADECSDMDYGSMHIDAVKFARAILKKANDV
jgi:hypothetical protein